MPRALSRSCGHVEILQAAERFGHSATDMLNNAHAKDAINSKDAAWVG
jgi:hypothetical protein